MANFDDYNNMTTVCAFCNHNRIYHVHVKEMAVIVCKVRNCRCYRNVANMMDFSDKVLKEMR